ncbi:MAG: hypothetical protein AB7I19_18540 [Planctomycetota bacterium]
MNSAISRVKGLSVTIVVAAVILTWWIGHDGARPPIEQAMSISSSGEPPIESNKRTVRLDRNDVEASTSSTLRIHVSDRSTGAPIELADVLLTPERREVLDVRDVKRLGQTGADGNLDTPRSNGHIVIRSAGYQSAEREIQQEDHALTPIVFALERAAELQILCHNRYGVGVPGVVFRASAAGLDFEIDVQSAADPNLIPGGDPRTAVFVGVSSDQGEIRLEGLRPGELSADVRHPRYCLVEGWPRNGFRLEPGENRLALIFDPLVGVHVEVVDDEVLAWQAEHPPAFFVPWESVSVLASRRTALTRGDRQRLCFLGCARYSREQGPTALPTSVSARILTAGRGWVTVPLPLRDVIQLDVPEMIEVGSFPLAEDVIDVDFEVVNLDGTRVPVDELKLQSTEQPVTSVSVPMGRNIRLPAGNYRLRARDPCLDHVLDTRTVTVARNESRSVRVTLGRRIRQAILNLTDESGYRLQSAGIAILADGLELSSQFSGRLWGRSIWLPVGQLTLTISSFGCSAVRHSLSIPEDGDEPIHLNLTVPRR